MQADVEEAKIPMPYDGLTDKQRINTGIVLALAAYVAFQIRQNGYTHACWHGGKHWKTGLITKSISYQQGGGGAKPGNP